MNWERLGQCAWHGFSAAVIAGGTSIAVLQAWPTQMQWLLIASGAAIALVKGVDGAVREPR